MSDEIDELKIIREFYGARRAKRSDVPLIQHIEEGLRIISARGGGQWAWRAFCLHPMFQTDEELAQRGQLLPDLHPAVVCLVMEYRAVANRYLRGEWSRNMNSSPTIHLSVLPAVNEMLVADKVQNRKDFEAHYSGPEKEALTAYFAAWMRALQIDEAEYRRLCAAVSKGSE